MHIIDIAQYWDILQSHGSNVVVSVHHRGSNDAINTSTLRPVLFASMAKLIMITHNTSYGILHRRVDERPTVYFTREKHQRHYLLERPAGATINRAGTVDTAVTTMSHFIETFNQDYGILTFSRRIECTLTLWTCSVYEVPLLHTYCIRSIPVMAGFHSFGLNPSFMSHGLNLSLSLSILVTTDVFFEYSTSSNNLALV